MRSITLLGVDHYRQFPPHSAMLHLPRAALSSQALSGCRQAKSAERTVSLGAKNARGIHTSSAALNRKCGIVGTSPVPPLPLKQVFIMCILPLRCCELSMELGLDL